MDDWMMQLGRVAYERWVEGMEGVIQMPGQVVMGLPPWTNSKVPEFCLPDDQKEIWAQVAITSISAYKAANVEVAHDPR